LGVSFYESIGINHNFLLIEAQNEKKGESLTSSSTVGDLFLTSNTLSPVLAVFSVKKENKKNNNEREHNSCTKLGQICQQVGLFRQIFSTKALQKHAINFPVTNF
jgi:hypothetical protein